MSRISGEHCRSTQTVIPYIGQHGYLLQTCYNQYYNNRDIQHIILIVLNALKYIQRTANGLKDNSYICMYYFLG